ncbi:MAG: Flp family type IVb pilin [Chloroflexi bacterium]|nr:Flp family type IVb pilin [Chloroflexota bacterium]
MLRMFVWLRDLVSREQGQDMVEYALITVLISLAIVLAAIGVLEGAFSDWANGLKAELLSKF